jgi:hypothetical protein
LEKIMNTLTSRPFHFLRIWGLLLVALVTVGCGSGGSDNNGGTSDFVFTGNNTIPGNAAPGSMTFNFIKPQNPLEVPTETTDIQFRFYSATGGNGTLLQQETRPFAASITIDPVDGATRSVVITALSADGYPILQSSVDVTTVPGEEVIVDFASATTVVVTQVALLINPPSANVAPGGTQQFSANLSFSNGDVLPANNVVWSATGQASIDVNTGLLTATTDGAATATATRDADMATANIIVGTGPVLTTLTVTPDGIDAGTGSQVQFSVTGVDQNGDPFTLTDVVWSIEAGTGTIDVDGLGDFPTVTVATIRATVDTVFDDATLNVLDSVPSVTFSGTSTGNLMFLSTESPTIADMPMDVTVTDDQANLLGGTLQFSQSLPGNIFNATFTVPATTIGAVSNNGSSNVSVLLNATATPAEIATLIETTTISFGGTNGMGTINVNLSDGNGNDAVPALRTFSIPDPVPMVALDAGTLTLDVNDTPVISAAATVMDDVDPAVTGTLSFSLTGTVTDATFTVPAAPAIGTINTNNTPAVSVDLMNASIADIQTVINTTTLSFGGTKGTGTINVAFTDQDGNTGNATRDFEITPLNLTVADMGADHMTIAAALAEVAGATGADGSTITVLPAYTLTSEGVTIGGAANDPDLEGLTILGNAAGQSAGVVPDPGGRPAPTVVSFFNVDNQTGVTIDGFNMTAGANGMIVGGTAAPTDLTIQNCLFLGAGDGIDLTASTNLTVANCGFTGQANGIDHNAGVTGGIYAGNFFDGCTTGIDLDAPDGTQAIQLNRFNNSTDHLNVTNGASGVTLVASANEFIGTGSVTTGAAAVATFTVDATSSWWGQVGGPLAGQTTTGANTVIDTSGFLVAPIFP